VRQRLTPTSLVTMSTPEVIKSMFESITGDLPENGIQSEGDLVLIEVALGRLANEYAYVIELLGYSRHYVRIFKRNGKDNKEQYEDMMDKRDCLENIASAVKLKYQAVSRMLTTKEQRNEENGMWGYRKDSRG
jgi:hypothetical protein